MQTQIRIIAYVRDKDGSENFRLYDADLETAVERDLTPMDDVQCRIVAHQKNFQMMCSSA